MKLIITNNTIDVLDVENNIEIFNKLKNHSHFITDNIMKFNNYHNSYFIGILVLASLLCIIFVIFVIVITKLIKR